MYRKRDPKLTARGDKLAKEEIRNTFIISKKNIGIRKINIAYRNSHDYGSEQGGKQAEVVYPITCWNPKPDYQEVQHHPSQKLSMQKRITLVLSSALLLKMVKQAKSQRAQRDDCKKVSQGNEIRNIGHRPCT